MRTASRSLIPFFFSSPSFFLFLLSISFLSSRTGYRRTYANAYPRWRTRVRRVLLHVSRLRESGSRERAIFINQEYRWRRGTRRILKVYATAGWLSLFRAHICARLNSLRKESNDDRSSFFLFWRRSYPRDPYDPPGWECENVRGTGNGRDSVRRWQPFVNERAFVLPMNGREISRWEADAYGDYGSPCSRWTAMRKKIIAEIKETSDFCFQICL